MNEYIAKRMMTNGTNKTLEPNIYATKTGQLRVQLRGKWLPGLSETLGGARIKLSDAKIEAIRSDMSAEIDRMIEAKEQVEADYHRRSVPHDMQMKIAKAEQRAAHILNKSTDFKISSKFKGVTWCKDKNKWKARVRISGKLEYLGRFDNEFVAANACQNALNRKT